MSTFDHRIRKLQTDDVVRLMREINSNTGKRFTESDIAAIWGISRQRVSQLRAGDVNERSYTRREIAMRSFPWVLDTTARSANLAKHLRDHLEFMATDGEGMSPRKLRDLMRFYRMIDTKNVVVEYSPEIPPAKPGMVPGWALRPRLETDGELIIRVNDYATMTEEAYQLFKRST